MLVPTVSPSDSLICVFMHLKRISGTSWRIPTTLELWSYPGRPYIHHPILLLKWLPPSNQQLVVNELNVFYGKKSQHNPLTMGQATPLLPPNFYNDLDAQELTIVDLANVLSPAPVSSTASAVCFTFNILSLDHPWRAPRLCHHHSLGRHIFINYPPLSSGPQAMTLHWWHSSPRSFIWHIHWGHRSGIF